VQRWASVAQLGWNKPFYHSSLFCPVLMSLFWNSAEIVAQLGISHQGQMFLHFIAGGVAVPLG